MASFNSLLAALVIAALAALAVAPDPVLLGSAADFVILTKTGISTVPPSVITGNIGASPVAATYMTGFSLIADATNAFSTSPQVTGKCYAADYATPTPSKMTTAIGDMETAYTDAAGRAVSDGANLDIKAGSITGETLTEGVYKWTSNILFSSDIYLKGNSESLFLFQTTGNIVVGAGAKVILQDDGSGSTPLASNIVWQVAGFLNAGTTSHLEGVFLVKTKAVFLTGSSLNGRVLSQTACTLDQATITQPSA